MGEVYKARDTRLERTVAVKVLPATLSASEEICQRFEREAMTGDGERFLISIPVLRSTSRMVDLLVNWPDALKR